MDDTASAPLITTVIRAHNRANTIDRAIQSALAQTLDGQPIVVVDDASSDNTPERVRAYGDRVQLIVHDENRGPGAAGNTGLAAVATPFVAFLDSDDDWQPRFLERMTAALQADPTKVFAYCNFRVVYDHADIDLPAETPEVPTEPADVVKAIRAITSATGGLTAALRRVGGFREQLWYNEDQDLQVRCALRYPGGFIRVPEYLLNYHIHDKNLTGDYDKRIPLRIEMLDKYSMHPEMRQIRHELNQIKSNYLIRMAGRKFVRNQVNKTQTRSVSLLVLNAEDAASVKASLLSSAAQPLPPIEVFVAGRSSPELDGILACDWPFRLTRIDPAIQHDWQTLRHVIAASQGELLAFLNAGDKWTETALDRHRRAFGSNLKRVVFSYGGFADDKGEAAPLAGDAVQRIYQMIAYWVPGSLSAMVVDRRTLSHLPPLPLPTDCPLWLAIASRLSLEKPGVAVRLRDPAVAQGERQTRQVTAIHNLLATLSEIRPGMQVAALAERLAVDSVPSNVALPKRLIGTTDREHT